MASIKENRNKAGEIISYRFRACVGRNDAYKQIFRTVTIDRPEGMTPAKERKEVERLAAEWEKKEREAFRQGMSAEKDKITLAGFIREHWTPDHVENGKHSANGREFFKYTAGIVVEYFGEKMKLVEVTPERIKRFLKWLRTEKQYSEATQQHILHTLSNILNYAVRTSYLDRNPTERLAAADKPTVTAKPIDFLTVDEARLFLEALEKAPLFWRAFYNLLLFAGLRRGEALGVKWSDYDAQEKTLTICRNITPDKEADSKKCVKSTKTGRNRVVPIADGLADLLERRREDVIGKYGKVSPDWFIFGKDEQPDAPLYPTSATTWLRRFERRNGLREVSCHDLRHSAASLGMEAGADLKQVQNLLGHSNPTVTMRFYAGITQERTRRAVQGIENLVRGAQTPADKPKA